MATSVTILAQAYEASQVVSLNCLNTLIGNKETKMTPHFSSPDDPNPVKFCLELYFGSKKEGYLSVFVNNQSNRRVHSEYFSFTLSSDVLLKQIEDKCAKFFECEGYSNSKDGRFRSWGWQEFYKLSDLKDVKTSKQAWDIQIHFKIKYIGEFNQTTKINKIEDTYPLCRLSDDLFTTFINEEDFDITLDVDGKNIRAHRYILTARSEYFRSMFRSGMVEANSDKIKMKDCDFDLFKMMIKFLYTDIPPDEIDGIATKLLPVADKFLVMKLKHHCEESLLKSLKEENVKEVLLLAHKYNCPTLKKCCFNMLTLSMCNNWSELKSYPDLSFECLQFLSNCHGN